MENLFAYGTLMCEDIMRDVAGCRFSHVPGTLKGYSRRRVKGEHYPAIIADDESCVDGVVYKEVTEAVWQRLDRFEGQMYARQRVKIEMIDGTHLDAGTYIVKPDFIDHLEASEWDFDAFLKNAKAIFQRSYRGYREL